MLPYLEITKLLLPTLKIPNVVLKGFCFQLCKNGMRVQFQAFSHDNNRQFLSPSRKRTQKCTGKNIAYKVFAEEQKKKRF